MLQNDFHASTDFLFLLFNECMTIMHQLVTETLTNLIHFRDRCTTNFILVIIVILMSVLLMHGLDIGVLINLVYLNIAEKIMHFYLFLLKKFRRKGLGKKIGCLYFVNQFYIQLIKCTENYKITLCYTS